MLLPDISKKAIKSVFLPRPPGPEFRENQRERGRRSPENRSQGLRPPWGVHASPRRRGAAGRGGSPSGSRAPGGGAHPGRAAAAHGTASGAKRAGSRARRGRTAGKAGLPGQKRAGSPGNGAQRARFGRQPGRSAGRKPGKPGGCGAETSASGGVLPGKQRGGGAKTAGFRGCGRQKGQKKPPHGGFRAGSGAWYGILRTACDGFTLFFNPAPRTRSPSRLYR